MWEYTEYDIRTLPTLFVVLLLAALMLAFLLRDKARWMRRIPTAAIALLLLFLEVLKQRWNLLGEFDAYLLPFHYCSLFVLVIPLAELCGERLSRIFRPAAAGMAFAVSVALYNCPSGIIGNACETVGTYFRPTHSVLFHHLVMFYLLLVVALHLCTPCLRDILTVGGIGAGYAAMAIPLSHILDANYCNFLYSVLPPLEELRLTWGQAAYTLIITAGVTVGAMLGSLLFVAVCRLIELCFFRNDPID